MISFSHLIVLLAFCSTCTTVTTELHCPKEGNITRDDVRKSVFDCYTVAKVTVNLIEKRGNESVDYNVYRVQYVSFYKKKGSVASAKNNVHRKLVLDQRCPELSNKEPYVMGCPKYSQCDRGFTKLRSQLSREELDLLL